MLAQFKVWIDVGAALWLLFVVATVSTQNLKSHLIYKFVPLVFAMLLVASEAKVLFG